MTTKEFTIIGSGPGGLTSAHELSKKFSSIEVFEEGKKYNSDDYKHLSITSMLNKSWRNSGFTPIIGSPTIVFSEGVGVGGTSLINGGVITRTRLEILKNWENDLGKENFNLIDILNFFSENEKILSVTNSNILGNKDSILLENNAKILNYKTSNATRAVVNCKNHNRCAFGCTSGAKQSLDVALIPKIEKKVKIFSNHKLCQIISDGKDYVNKIVIKDNNTQKYIEKKVNHLILSAGVLQTPKILLKNKLIDRSHPMQFHLNLKIFSKFRFNLNSENSTILSKHVREFADDGVLMMTSNFNDSINAAGMAHFNSKIIENFIENKNNSAVFNLQLQPSTSNANLKKFLNCYYLKWFLSDKDFLNIKKYLKELIKIIYVSDPIEIYLPIVNSKPINSYKEAINLIENVSKSKLIMNTVHAMSTCSISKKISKTFILPTGRLAKYKNVFISDASVLPSNTGEHPQNTIMALSRNLIQKNFF